MRVRIGTSGYQYKFWRGGFYSEKAKEADMLAEYGAKLTTVEINNTFYRMPRSAVLERWAAQVPEDFRFTIKASRRITHIGRLRDVGEHVRYLIETSRVLGDRLGALLFQLPPNLKQDSERLQGLLDVLGGTRAAIEFRHESWFSDEVYARLRAHNAALCISDEGEGEKATPFVATADFGYLRLRKETYAQEELEQVAAQMRAQSWGEAVAYFKHEQDAPTLAARLQGLF